VRDSYGSMVTCVLPDMVMGANMTVAVVSGRLNAVTEVEPSIGRSSATLTSMAPIINRISANDTACTEPRQSLLAVGRCTVMSPFYVAVCATIESVGDYLPHLNVLLGDSRQLLDCGPFTRNYPSLVCATCEVFPQLGKLVPVRLQQKYVPTLTSQISALVSFDPCPVGYRVDTRSSWSDRPTSVCTPCPPGTSTRNNTGQFDCDVCPAGRFANESGDESPNIFFICFQIGEQNESVPVLLCQPGSTGGIWRQGA
jgi:hypothetical protein